MLLLPNLGLFKHLLIIGIDVKFKLLDIGLKRLKVSGHHLNRFFKFILEGELLSVDLRKGHGLVGTKFLLVFIIDIVIVKNLDHLVDHVVHNLSCCGGHFFCCFVVRLGMPFCQTQDLH